MLSFVTVSVATAALFSSVSGTPVEKRQDAGVLPGSLLDPILGLTSVIPELGPLFPGLSSGLKKAKRQLGLGLLNGLSLPNALIPSIPGVTVPLASNAPPLPILQLPTPPLPDIPFAVTNVKPKKIGYIWTGAGDNIHADFLVGLSLDDVSDRNYGLLANSNQFFRIPLAKSSPSLMFQLVVTALIILVLPLTVKPSLEVDFYLF